MLPFTSNLVGARRPDAYVAGGLVNRHNDSSSCLVTDVEVPVVRIPAQVVCSGNAKPPALWCGVVVHHDKDCCIGARALNSCGSCRSAVDVQPSVRPRRPDAYAARISDSHAFVAACAKSLVASVDVSSDESKGASAARSLIAVQLYYGAASAADCSARSQIYSVRVGVIGSSGNQCEDSVGAGCQAPLVGSV